VKYLTETVHAFLEAVRSGRGLDTDTAVAAASGDADAAGKVFEQYKNLLYKIANAHAKGDTHSADDAVGDTFVKLIDGKFKKMGDQIRGGAPPEKLVSAMTAAVINRLKNIKRAKARHGMTDVSKVEPAAPPLHQSQLSKEERQIVQKAVRGALKKSKLTVKEREYLEMLLGKGELLDITRFSGYGGRGAASKQTLASLAYAVWPTEKPGTAVLRAKRVRERFLKQFCGDPTLGKLVPTGHARKARSRFFRANIAPLCAEENRSVFEFAFTHGLVESEGVLDASVVDVQVLSWIAEVISD
jgi:DNA-directed RNA polymerase specialized sigma24 family protein